jgi:tRNA (guanine37-N1)-methyltransferase
MVMSPVAWGEAIDEITSDNETVDLIILTPAGKKFDQKMASKFASAKHIIFACGRYEGIDARVGEYYSSKSNFKVHEVSIGDYVLGGGEVAAMVIIEATARLIPGVIGNPDSLKEESHSISGNNDDLLVEYPNYTKPANWRGLEVPPILLSGNHGEIAKWRKEQAERRTRELGRE